MRNRRSLLECLVGLGVLAVAPLPAAPLPTGQRRLGVLLFDRAELWDFFPPQLQKELAALGWVEGKNLSVQWRYANGDNGMLKTMAAQMVKSGVDAILTRGTPSTRILQQATTTVPISTGVGDPVGFGFAKTLSHPGGNITGLSWATVEASRKQIELLRAMAPRLSEILVVLPSDRLAFIKDLTSPIDAAARELGVAIRIAVAAGPVEARAALETTRPRGEVGAFLSFAGTFFAPKAMAELAIAAGLPTMFDERGYVDAGGLASYRFDWDNQSQRSAAQLDKIFRGDKPAQIPFELPTRSEFVLNLTTAKALGLTIPNALLQRADAVVQ
jgi:putative ABC transport system substrate-binding protein